MEIYEINHQEATQFSEESVQVCTKIGKDELMVRCYGPRKAFGELVPAEVNWNAMGSVSLAHAEAYGQLLIHAAARAATLSGPTG